MANFFGYDVPECLSGNIIGGDRLPASGRCFYAGRPQGQKIYAKNNKRLEKILRCKIKKLKEQVPYGYPDEKWTLRIYI